MLQWAGHVARIGGDKKCL